MNFMTKLIISAITIGFTVFGGFYAAIKENNNNIASQVLASKAEIYDKIVTLRDERNSLMEAQDAKFSAQMIAVNTSMIEIKKDVRMILSLTRKANVDVEKRKKWYYTLRELEQNDKGNRL